MDEFLESVMTVMLITTTLCGIVLLATLVVIFVRRMIP